MRQGRPRGAAARPCRSGRRERSGRYVACLTSFLRNRGAGLGARTTGIRRCGRWTSLVPVGQGLLRPWMSGIISATRPPCIVAAKDRWAPSLQSCLAASAPVAGAPSPPHPVISATAVGIVQLHPRAGRLRRHFGGHVRPAACLSRRASIACGFRALQTLGRGAVAQRFDHWDQPGDGRAVAIRASTRANQHYPQRGRLTPAAGAPISPSRGTRPPPPRGPAKQTEAIAPLPRRPAPGAPFLRLQGRRQAQASGQRPAGHFRGAVPAFRPGRLAAALSPMACESRAPRHLAVTARLNHVSPWSPLHLSSARSRLGYAAPQGRRPS